MSAVVHSYWSALLFCKRDAYLPRYIARERETRPMITCLWAEIHFHWLAIFTVFMGNFNSENTNVGTPD